MLIAPGLAEDLDAMAVLSESIDGRDDSTAAGSRRPGYLDGNSAILREQRLRKVVLSRRMSAAAGTPGSCY